MTSPDNIGQQFKKIIQGSWTPDERDVAVLSGVGDTMVNNVADLPEHLVDFSDKNGPRAVLPGNSPEFEHHWTGGSHITHYYKSSPNIKLNMGESPVPRPGPLREEDLRQVTDAWESSQDTSSKKYTQYGYIAPEDRTSTSPVPNKASTVVDDKILGQTDVWRHSPFRPE